MTAPATFVVWVDMTGRPCVTTGTVGRLGPAGPAGIITRRTDR